MSEPGSVTTRTRTNKADLIRLKTSGRSRDSSSEEIAKLAGTWRIRAKVNAIPGLFRMVFLGEPERDSGMKVNTIPR